MTSAATRIKRAQLPVRGGQWQEMPLLAAIRDGDIPTVRTHVRAGCGVNDCYASLAREDDGTTPLTLACRLGKATVVKMLLGMRADPNLPDFYNRYPLLAACEGDRLPCIQALLEAKASMEVASDSGLTALHIATDRGFPASAGALLRAGAPVDRPVRPRPGARTPVFVKDSVVASQRGWTPLHFAAAKGHPAVAQVLLASGADPDKLSKAGDSPLHLAALSGNCAIAEALLQRGATVDQPFVRVFPGEPPVQETRTALHLAAEAGHAPLVRLLVEWHADVEALFVTTEGGVTMSGVPALQIAIEDSRLGVVRELLSLGAALDLATDIGDVGMEEVCQALGKPTFTSAVQEERARRSRGSRNPGITYGARAPPVPRRGAWYSTSVVLVHDPMFGVDVDKVATEQGATGLVGVAAAARPAMERRRRGAEGPFGASSRGAFFGSTPRPLTPPAPPPRPRAVEKPTPSTFSPIQMSRYGVRTVPSVAFSPPTSPRGWVRPRSRSPTSASARGRSAASSRTPLSSPRSLSAPRW